MTVSRSEFRHPRQTNADVGWIRAKFKVNFREETRRIPDGDR